MTISMMEAYGIELLKANGITFEQVTEQFTQTNPTFDIEEGFDFTVLKALYHADLQTFEQAYQGHYSVKFLTLNGLRNILRMRFHIPLEAYETLEAGNGLTGIPASAQVEQQLRAFVSSNWKVERHGETLTLYV